MNYLQRSSPRPAVKPPEGKTESDANAGYVTELVGYHALKRVSADITRGLSSVVGLGNDVRIMIVDRLDYATGDIPFIEVTSQLSVFEVRCRKQVATNKELADLAMQKDEQGDEEKTPAVKSGATRLAPLAASPFFLPAITTAATALPAVTGIAGTRCRHCRVLQVRLFLQRPERFSKNRGSHRCGGGITEVRETERVCL